MGHTHKLLALTVIVLIAPKNAQAGPCTREGETFCAVDTAGIPRNFKCDNRMMPVMTNDTCPPVPAPTKRPPAAGKKTEAPHIKYNDPPKRKPVEVPPPQLSETERKGTRYTCEQLKHIPAGRLEELGLMPRLAQCLGIPYR